jgi:hypothetical protein
VLHCVIREQKAHPAGSEGFAPLAGPERFGGPLETVLEIAEETFKNEGAAGWDELGFASAGPPSNAA